MDTISVKPIASACWSGVTPALSPIDRSAPAATRRRTISWCAGPPSPEDHRLEQRRPAEVVDVVDIDRRFGRARRAPSRRAHGRPPGSAPSRRTGSSARRRGRREVPRRARRRLPFPRARGSAFERMSSCTSTSAPAATSSRTVSGLPAYTAAVTAVRPLRVTLIGARTTVEETPNSGDVPGGGRLEQLARRDGLGLVARSRSSLPARTQR